MCKYTVYSQCVVCGKEFVIAYRVGRPEIFCSDKCREDDRRAHVRLYVAHYHDRHRGRKRLRNPWEWDFTDTMFGELDMNRDEIRDWERKIGQS